MAMFEVAAKIKQTVDRTVHLLLEAKTAEDAEKMAQEVVELYPEPGPFVPGMRRVVTTSNKYRSPKTVSFTVTEQGVLSNG